MLPCFASPSSSRKLPISKSVPLLIVHAAAIGSDGAWAGTPRMSCTAPQSVVMTASLWFHCSRKMLLSRYPFAHEGCPSGELSAHTTASGSQAGGHA